MSHRQEQLLLGLNESWIGDIDPILHHWTEPGSMERSETIRGWNAGSFTRGVHQSEVRSHLWSWGREDEWGLVIPEVIDGRQSGMVKE